MGLFRFLAIALFIYFIVRIIARFILPFLAKYVMRKASQKMQEQVKTKNEGEKVYQDEKVIIRKPSQKADHPSNPDDDEFVDYEEV